MLKIQIALTTLSISLIAFNSCGQKNTTETQVQQSVEEVTEVSNEDTPVVKKKKMHSYGGWFCPDNLGGFPPVDIQQLDRIEVVNDRLPTKEETRNGISLMYFDTTEIPNAKPLNMQMPRLARIHSNHNGMKELIVVIQAIVANNDTVVGYRFPSGGNGSAWYHEVDFLSDDEANALAPTPFVHFDSKIKANTAEIWKAISSTTFASKIGKQFDQQAFFEQDWTEESRVHLNFESDSLKASGIIATLFGNLYLHIDYDYNGFHFTEKILVGENQENKTANLVVVAGPYPDNFSIEQNSWKKWLKEVKMSSELNSSQGPFPHITD